MRLLLDVDGVIADFYAHCETITGRVIWHDRKLEHCLPESTWRTLERAMCAPGWVESMPEIPGAVGLVRRLRVPYTFVTSPWESSPTWAYERTRWLRKRFPDCEVIHTREKHRVKGLLIDDAVKHVDAHRNTWQEAYLVAGPTTPHGNTLREILEALDVLGS